MHVAVVFALLQQPAAPASFPITKVEITPPAAEIEIGQTVRLAARALDARGQPVADAKIAWLSGGTEGDVDSTGLVKGGYHGYVRVTAVAYLPGQQGQVFGDALIHVLPEPAARIDVTPAAARVVAGTRLTLAGVAFSKHGESVIRTPLPRSISTTRSDFADARNGSAMAKISIADVTTFRRRENIQRPTSNVEL